MSYVTYTNSFGSIKLDYDDVKTLLSGTSWRVRRDDVVVIQFGKSKTKLLHRLIMEAPPHLEVDHINGDRRDNRRSNLRLCNRQGNACNRGANKTGRVYEHSFKGISRSSNKKLNKRWRARVGIGGKAYYSKYFFTSEEAAHAYDKLAKKHHGEFARLNFP